MLTRCVVGATGGDRGPRHGRVMGYKKADELAARMAEGQCGLISTAQLVAVGHSYGAIRHRVMAGRMSVLLPGVYALAGAPRTYERDLWAAHLWQGDGSAISHEAAAHLWGFDRFAAGSIEISSTNHKNCWRPSLDDGTPIVVHRVDEHLLSEIVRYKELPITSSRRTILDLCGRKDWRAGRALDQALRLQMVDIGDMWLYHEQEWMRGRRGVRILGNLLVDRTPGKAPADSDLENELHDLLVSAGFPPPLHQYPVPIAERTIHIDLAYPDAMLAIEVDGYAWHGDHEAFERDRERDIELKMRGWTVLRFTWAKIRFDRAFVLQAVEHHLSRGSPALR